MCPSASLSDHFQLELSAKDSSWHKSPHLSAVVSLPQPYGSVDLPGWSGLRGSLHYGCIVLNIALKSGCSSNTMVLLVKITMPEDPPARRKKREGGINKRSNVIRYRFFGCFPVKPNRCKQHRQLLRLNWHPHWSRAMGSMMPRRSNRRKWALLSPMPPLSPRGFGEDAYFAAHA